MLYINGQGFVSISTLATVQGVGRKLGRTDEKTSLRLSDDGLLYYPASWRTWHFNV